MAKDLKHLLFTLENGEVKDELNAVLNHNLKLIRRKCIHITATNTVANKKLERIQPYLEVQGLGMPLFNVRR